jgi:Ni/Fe-hydrogenase subunit HybB-like protein
VTGANNLRLVVTKAVLWMLVGIGSVVAVSRYVRGLGATTALNDSTPWGLWIGFDVLSGVALAAGGFVIAATVYIFRLDRYHALVRPAVLTAFLGYIAVVLGLLVDLGRPWNIWRMVFFWQPHSPLFEVGWCVMLYLTVLALEFAPVVFEGMRWERALRFMRPATLALVILGISLSTLHQSSLGSLFLLQQDRLHPLWYSPILPLLFFVSAVGLGLCMVTAESCVSSWLYRRPGEWPLLRGLTRAAAVVLAVYLVLRLGDLGWRGELVHIVEGSWASALFVVELAASAVVPLLLFTMAGQRGGRWAVAAGAGLGVCGFVLHRATVGGISHIPVTGVSYAPAITELTVSVGLVAGMALLFLLAVERLPVWEDPAPVPEHFTPPMQDGLTRSYFGGPWFGRAHLAALGWIVGAVLGVTLLETTTADGSAPRPSPARSARTVAAERFETAPGEGYRLRLCAVPGADSELPPLFVNALLIDGDLGGQSVLFDHEVHQHRLGAGRSCGVCHHRNLALDRATPCATCHRDMYRDSDIFDHQEHVAALAGNRSCARCHADASLGKDRSSATACRECHARDVSPNWTVQPRMGTEPGVAIGYRDAMHGLCIDCHRNEDAKQGAQEGRLSRCTTCHRSGATDGDELVPRDSWRVAALGAP